ncbi:response regulator [Dyella choica]|uniref:Response regulator n=1 Tax=Dyella choica TaxID=1927959 RepID=A0A432M6B8_9GAMM|nr:response regulator [Dyella choica]RUL76069.1 response regulator [Dyella choica]
MPIIRNLYRSLDIGIPRSNAQAISILLVEQHPANRLVFDQPLRCIGCLVTSCADGTTALRLFGGKSLDMVLLDGALPDWSGYEAIIDSMLDALVVH